MSFTLKYHPRAFRRLKSFQKHEQRRVLQRLIELGKNPLRKELDIRKMAENRSSFRLRIANIRVIYEINFEMKIIYIEDIDYRGNIY